MLIRELVSSRRFIALAVLGAGVATGAMVSSTPTTAGVPVVAVDEVRMLAPSASSSSVVDDAPPPAALAAPDCGNVAAIGAAISIHDLGLARADEHALDAIGGTSAGCTIAAWTEHELAVSWDAGRHFARIAFDQPEDEWRRPTILAAPDRIVVLRDHELGAIRRGATAIAWRALEPSMISPEAYLEVAVGGRWTAIKNEETHVVGVTEDDGTTWRYLAIPRDEVMRRELRVTEAGQLWLDEMTYRETKIPEGEPLAVIHHRRAEGPRWIADDAGAHRSSRWLYETPTDEDWGCGTSQRIIAVRGAERAVVARNAEALRDHVTVVHNARGAYAQYDSALYLIQGTRTTKLADVLDLAPRVAGVDANGALIAVLGGRVVRWSPRGGWRLLWGDRATASRTRN